jgi:hypothetical protein
MTRGRISRVFAFDAEQSDSTDFADQQRLPTLDERVNRFLQTVHGRNDFTAKERSDARALILDSMAADIASKSKPQHPNRPQGDRTLGEGKVNSWPLPSFASSEAMIRPALPRELDVTELASQVLPSVPSRRQKRIKRTSSIGVAISIAAIGALLLVGIFSTGWFFADPNSLGSPVADTFLKSQASGRPERRSVELLQQEVTVYGVAPRVPRDRQIPPDEVADLLKRGQDLIADGKFGLARLALARAAEAGSAPAALALGWTYDPRSATTLEVGQPQQGETTGPRALSATQQVQARRQTLDMSKKLRLSKELRPDTTPDIGMARAWYEKARDLGSADAARLLEQLPPSDPAPAR